MAVLHTSKSGKYSGECVIRKQYYRFQRKYLIEQDHRFIKRLTKPGMGFFSFQTAWCTLQGYETMNMMRKGQIHGVEKGDIRDQVSFIATLFGVAA